MTILFLHGWHSIPGGVKPTYLKDHGHTVLNPALNDDDFAAAVATAQAEFDQHQPDLVVGSSRGDEHRQWQRQARHAQPGMEELGISQGGEARHGDPAGPPSIRYRRLQFQDRMKSKYRYEPATS